MTTLLLCAILGILPQQSRGYTPLPSISTDAINANFLDMAQEIQRRSIKDGGVVNANVKFSSSVNFTGIVNFSSNPVGLGSISTYTLINYNIALTGTSLGPCVAGTTLTWTGKGLKTRFIFSGNILAEPSNTRALIGVLLDGDFLPGYSSTMGQGYAEDSGAVVAENEHIAFMPSTRTALSAGSHSACITASGGTGGATLACTHAGCNFEVEELN